MSSGADKESIILLTKKIFFSVYEINIFFSDFKPCLENRAPAVAAAARSSNKKEPTRARRSSSYSTLQCNARPDPKERQRRRRQRQTHTAEKTRDKESGTALPFLLQSRTAKVTAPRVGALRCVGALLYGTLCPSPPPPSLAADAAARGGAGWPGRPRAGIEACAAAAAPEMDLSLTRVKGTIFSPRTVPCITAAAEERKKNGSVRRNEKKKTETKFLGSRGPHGERFIGSWLSSSAGEAEGDSQRKKHGRVNFFQSEFACFLRGIGAPAV